MDDNLELEATTEETSQEEALQPQQDVQRDEALRKAFDWFEVDRNHKATIAAELEEIYKLYKCDHWDLMGPTGAPLRTDEQKKARPNTVENIAFALIEGLVAEFSEDVDLIDYPVEQGDDEIAAIMTDIKEFISYKNRISSEREKWLRNFFLYGTGIWHNYWDPHWSGGRGPNRWVGDVRWKSLHPSAIFPDARCRESIEDGRRIHKAFYVTQEYVKEKYGVEIAADMIREDMLLGDDVTASEIGAELGEEQVLLVETWYKGEPLFLDEDEENHGPGMHVIWWAGDGTPEYLAHANYVYYDPGEDPKWPFVFRNRYPRENSVWGFGEAHFLKSPQIVANKTSELILEGHMHESLGQTFYKESAVTPNQKKTIEQFGTLAGMWFPMQDPSGVERKFGKGVPETLLRESERIQKSMEMIVGRFDISQGRTPGSVTAFRALDLLAARAQVRLRSAERSMTTAYEDCGNYVNNLVQKFYTERRAYRILGDDIGQMETVMVNIQTGEEMSSEMMEQQAAQQGMEGMNLQAMMAGQGWVPQKKVKQGGKYGTFDMEKLKKVFVYDTAEVFSFEEFEPGEGMIEGEQYEVYSPQFDVICKASSSMPTDRVFYLEMAKELYGGQLIDAETFWYVLSHGKFPPWEELMEKEREKMLMAQQQAMQQQKAQEEAAAAANKGGAGTEQPPTQQQADPMQMIGDVLASNPELAQQLQGLPPEKQAEIIAQVSGGGG